MSQEEQPKITPKEQKIIEKAVKEFLKLLSVEGDLKISYEDGLVNVALDTPDTGIVIGYHGEVLESLSLILSLCVSGKLDRFVHVFVDVGDYKKNRVEALQKLAQQTKERVRDQQREVYLPNLKSWERRTIHLFLQEDSDVVSESVGEGKERTLVVKPRI